MILLFQNSTAVTFHSDLPQVYTQTLEDVLTRDAYLNPKGVSDLWSIVVLARCGIWDTNGRPWRLEGPLVHGRHSIVATRSCLMGSGSSEQ